jgi:hypothetical protein
MQEMWELKRWMQRQQKNKADQFSKRVVPIILLVVEDNNAR